MIWHFQMDDLSIGLQTQLLFGQKERHEDLQKDRNAINGLSEKEKVVSFYSENPVQSCSHFTLIDKQKARMEVFKVKNEK